MFGGPVIDESGSVLSDWKAIIDQGISRIKSAGAINQELTLYTVPAGKKFYLLSAFIHNYEATASTGLGTLFFDGDAVTNRILTMKGTSTATATMSSSSSYPLPVLFTAGSTIEIKSDAANLVTTGIITGYEVNA